MQGAPDSDSIPLPALYAGHRSGDASFQERITSVVYATSELGVIRALESGPRGLAELARGAGAPPERLVRLLRAAAALDLVDEREDGNFAAAAMTRFVPPPPHSHPAARSSDPFLRSWAALSESLRSGETAFEIANGVPLFDLLAQDPEQRSAFDRKMEHRGADRDQALAVHLGPLHDGTVVDLGGGRGGLLAAILRPNPQLQGVLVDAPEPIAGIQAAPAEGLAADRFQAVARDVFRDPLPSGDVYILSSVLHDWEDDDCVRLLRNVAGAMQRSARLLVVEMVLPLPNNPVLGPLFDLDMLVLTGGRERTENEYARLLTAAGMEVVRAAPLTGIWSTIEARPSP